jgi:hypothetical protein
MRKSVEPVTLGLMVIWGVIWWALAVPWPFAARLFPIAIAIPFVLLSSLQFFFSLRSARRGGTTPVQTQDVAPKALGTYIPEEDSDTEIVSLEPKEVAHLVVWLFAFAALIILFGFVIGLSLGVVAYLKVEARSSWVVGAFLALGTLMYLYILAVPILHVPMDSPLAVDLLRAVTGIE